jgi:glutathione S-transferase
VRPRVLRQSGDESVVRRHLEEVVPPVFDQLETLFLAPGPLRAGFVAPGAGAPVSAPLDIAAIAIWSPIVNLEHVGVRIDAAQWPRLAAFMEASNAHPALRPIVAEERAALGLGAA